MKYYRTDELYHHGIKGQRWGVRRYQNSDGSLTAAGRKRYDVVDKAKKELSKRAEADRQYAVEDRAKGDALHKRYSGKNGYKNWLDDEFGSDWKDSKYMKDVFDIDDVEKYGRESAKGQAKKARDRYYSLADENEKSARAYESIAKNLDSKRISDISNDDVKKAKKFLKHPNKGLSIFDYPITDD